MLSSSFYSPTPSTFQRHWSHAWISFCSLSNFDHGAFFNSKQTNKSVDFVIYTDAAASGEGLRQTVTLSFVILSETFCRAAQAVMPLNMMASFESRSTYIAHGEAMACLFCLHHLRKRLAGASVIHFIDNLGVLSAMCSGNSTVFDISRIISATLAIEAALGMKSWKEHVDSKANLADCGTKDVTD